MEKILRLTSIVYRKNLMYIVLVFPALVLWRILCQHLHHIWIRTTAITVMYIHKIMVLLIATMEIWTTSVLVCHIHLLMFQYVLNKLFPRRIRWIFIRKLLEPKSIKSIYMIQNSYFRPLIRMWYHRITQPALLHSHHLLKHHLVPYQWYREAEAMDYIQA